MAHFVSINNFVIDVVSAILIMLCMFRCIDVDSKYQVHVMGCVPYIR
jgi:hypothetical protein